VQQGLLFSLILVFGPKVFSRFLPLMMFNQQEESETAAAAAANTCLQKWAGASSN
jgi:hypothetical protein